MENKFILVESGVLKIIPTLFSGQPGKVELRKSDVDSYEVITEEKTKSAVSVVGRGAFGAFLLGPIGLLAAASAKNKGVHVVALQFRHGAKSLIEVDDKIYKNLLKMLF
jgi:hypothetical protein